MYISPAGMYISAAGMYISAAKIKFFSGINKLSDGEVMFSFLYRKVLITIVYPAKFNTFAAYGKALSESDGGVAGQSY